MSAPKKSPVLPAGLNNHITKSQHGKYYNFGTLPFELRPAIVQMSWSDIQIFPENANYLKIILS